MADKKDIKSFDDLTDETENGWEQSSAEEIVDPWAEPEQSKGTITQDPADTSSDLNGSVRTQDEAAQIPAEEISVLSETDAVLGHAAEHHQTDDLIVDEEPAVQQRAADPVGFDDTVLDIPEDLDEGPFEVMDEEIPDLDIETTAFNVDEHERKLEEKFFRATVQLSTSDLYVNVLQTLYDADDMGIDNTTRSRIAEAQRLPKLPQMVCRDLVQQRVVSPSQLARATARTLKRKEITSFLGIPQEAMQLRNKLDSRVVGLLREERVIPLWHKRKSDEEIEGNSELHLAHESATRNLVLESAISEYLPDHKFVWHFALRDVCGAFWLSGDDEDVDASMEAEALLDRIIGNAIDARSSDIHVDPSIKGDFKAIVKYRIDGFVQSKEVITLDQLERLRVRIENVARMPKVDLNHPNKGAFTRAGYDWRVQVQPHAGRQGPLPRVVIRRLKPDVMSMDELGYPDYFIKDVKESASSPNGVILWTGPTGSGKTESIHSAIVSVNPMGRGLSVHTIEDPPEKRVPGYAVQMEISEADGKRSGLELLKSSLRADPDVIVFGEVRDSEMSKLVFEAANTGHLVFTTLHTNTSLDAITRLDELGIYGFALSYVRGIAAQRLVRRLCAHCKQPVAKPDEYTQYVFDKYGVEIQGAQLFKHDPGGCPSCNHTGYHGRIAIAELLKPNKELIDASTARDYSKLEEIAQRAGWKPMGHMAVQHVKAGITDVDEIASKVQELSGDLEG